MKIARYIGDLLYDYECVVIPGLGGFLTSETPATINRVTHHFKPPFKKIFFNTQLRANDGLLINYVAKEMGLTYREAKSQVDKFVFLCHNALKNGKRINFHKIGYIYMNSKEQIVFEQDTTINYDAESYGLTGFVSPAVRRESPEEVLKEKVASVASAAKPASKKENRPAKVPEPPKKSPSTPPHEHHSTHHMQAEVRRSTFKTQLTFMTLIVLAMLVGIAIMNKESVKVYYDKYASQIPLFYRSVNSYAMDNLDKIALTHFITSQRGEQLAHWLDNITSTQEMRKREMASSNTRTTWKQADNNLSVKTKPTGTEPEASTEPPSDNVQQASLLDNILPAQEEELSQPEERNTEIQEIPAETESVTMETPEPVNEPTARSFNKTEYYIIAGSFKSVHNARKLVQKLRSYGYKALIADTNKYGMYRVAYEKISEQTLAEQRLVAIRNEENKRAWLMKK